jgi:hypothetical protein
MDELRAWLGCVSVRNGATDEKSSGAIFDDDQVDSDFVKFCRLSYSQPR